MIFIDTDIAIALRDAYEATHRQVGALPEIPSLSLITRIELESGVNADPALTTHRRRLLEILLDRHWG